MLIGTMSKEHPKSQKFDKWGAMNQNAFASVNGTTTVANKLKTLINVQTHNLLPALAVTHVQLHILPLPLSKRYVFCIMECTNLIHK
jgi:hypothetical protein